MTIARTLMRAITGADYPDHDRRPSSRLTGLRSFASAQPWPALLIVFGLLKLVGGRRGWGRVPPSSGTGSSTAPPPPPPNYGDLGAKP